MKKILYHTLSLLFASFFFASCEKENFQVTFEHGEGVTLRLRLSNNDLQSRAEGDRNDNEYNENAIKKVDLYLYKIDSDGKASGQALKKVSKTFETINKVELVTSLSNTEKENLFGNGTTCRAYALVNYTGTAPLANTNDSKIAALKALEITADFTTTQTSFVMDGESNVTYTEANREVTGTINVSRAASKISLFITSVEKTVTDAAGNIWEPDYGKMAITFHNGVNKATVDVGYTATTPARPNNTLAVGDNIYESSGIRDITATCTNPDNTTDLTWELTTSHAPFYSYSYDWANAANDDKNPIITIMVPWRKISEKDSNGNIVIIPETDRETKTTWQTCYYQIPVNAESKNGSLADCFERNMYYQIKLHVGILGDFNPATATTIPASYYTVDWKNQDVNVDIKNYKYLVVDKNDVTVYNENEIRIGYASSDPIQAEICYIRRPNYSEAKVDTTRFYGSLSSQSGTTSVSQETNSMLRACTVSVEGNEIVLNHDLVNKSSDDDVNYDYVPYYILIKVTMTVQVNGIDRTFTEWIRYEQYPAIYVKAHLNSDYDVNANRYNNSWVSTDNDNNGYVFVNGYQGSSKEGDSWPNAYVRNTYQQFLGTANGMSSNAGNKNPNMYVINVSALPKGSSYIIGDPRVKSLDGDLRDQKFTGGAQNNKSIWITANALNSTTQRKLTSPYPTDASKITSGSNVEDYTTGYMIAPKIRVASSYSVLTTNFVTDKEIARRRCASYQEDGYPAGRWRLPTYAEGEFMVKLSSEGKIPILFSKDSYYWCAHGYFDPADGTNDDGNVKYYNSSTRDVGASVRCVYDEWYWGSDPIADKTTFTWGDAPRN